MNKNFLITSLIALTLSFTAPQAQAEEFTQEQINQMIHDYIMENPMVIMQAVNEYQVQEQEKQMQQALTKNQRRLFEDDASPVAGNKRGDITIVEFFDYNCGYCKRALPTVQALIAEDKNLRVVFKEFPILGESSLLAAQWALAAHKQGKYQRFHNIIMESRGKITKDKLEETAEKVGMDIKRAKRDVNSNDIREHLTQNRQIAMDLGITGTPAFVIGDQVLPGALDLKTLQKVIAEERAKQKK